MDPVAGIMGVASAVTMRQTALHFWAGRVHGQEAIASLTTLTLTFPRGCVESCSLRRPFCVTLIQETATPNSSSDDRNTSSLPYKGKGKTACGSQRWSVRSEWESGNPRGRAGQSDATVLTVCLNLSFPLPEMSPPLLLLL